MLCEIKREELNILTIIKENNMDILMLVRSGIFLLVGLISIIFRKQLNNLKNQFLTKISKEKLVRDERNRYINIGLIFIAISIILLIYSITRYVQ